MAKKLPVGELLRLACIYAERDQQEYARCIAKGTDAGMVAEQEETAAFLRQLRAYRLKRWGKTKLEATMATMTPVTVAEIAKRHS